MTTRRIVVGNAHNPQPASEREIEARPRMIGIEVRYRDQFGTQEELFIEACDVILPPHVGRGYGGDLTVTAHLTYGDRNGTIPL